MARQSIVRRAELQLRRRLRRAVLRRRLVMSFGTRPIRPGPDAGPPRPEPATLRPCASVPRSLVASSPACWSPSPSPSSAQQQTPVDKPDIPEKFTRPTTGFDYDKRVEMIPMRDGVKLYTVIVVPKGAKDAPIIMTRTPYNAAGRTTRAQSASMLATLPQGDEVFVADGYIRVFQDVRGKYGSEGDYLMTRPLRGPLNPTNTDHSTDAYDTIDWLVKNVPESNGRVGMLGSSYEGFTVVMALVNPHPALKVAAPMSPMVDGWMGDDWFHFGAFRQPNFDFFAGQSAGRASGSTIVRQRLRRLRELPPRRLGRRLRQGQRARAAADVAQGVGAPGLRPVLAGAGARQDHGQAAAHHPDHVDPGHLGPGRHVGRDPELPRGGAEGHRQHPELPGDGPVAAQRRQLRGLVARAAEVRGRHRAAVPPRRAEAVLRPVPEGGRAEGRHAGRLHLQHRREPLGSLPALAARRAPRAATPPPSRCISPAASACRSPRPRPGARATPRASTSTSPIPAKPVPYLPRPVRFADGAALADLAAERPAGRRRPHRRAHLRHARAHRAGAHQRRAAGQPGRVDQRHPTATGW